MGIAVQCLLKQNRALKLKPRGKDRRLRLRLPARVRPHRPPPVRRGPHRPGRPAPRGGTGPRPVGNHRPEAPRPDRTLPGQEPGRPPDGRGPRARLHAAHRRHSRLERSTTRPSSPHPAVDAAARWSAPLLILIPVITISVTVSITVVLPQLERRPPSTDPSGGPRRGGRPDLGPTRSAGHGRRPGRDEPEQPARRGERGTPGRAARHRARLRLEWRSTTGARNWTTPAALPAVTSGSSPTISTPPNRPRWRKSRSSPDASLGRCARITTWTDRVAFADLRPGDQLCARSAEGRYAALRIESSPTLASRQRLLRLLRPRLEAPGECRLNPHDRPGSHGGTGLAVVIRVPRDMLVTVRLVPNSGSHGGPGLRGGDQGPARHYHPRLAPRSAALPLRVAGSGEFALGERSAGPGGQQGDVTQ